MDFIKNFNNIKQGYAGEDVLRKILKEKKHQFGQIDLISIDLKGNSYIYEVKHQERFNGPPFDGHGLSPIQVNFRIKLAKKHNFIPILFIVEPEVDLLGNIQVFYQSLFHLNELPSEKKFITNTGRRIIYDINEFNHKEIPALDCNIF